MQNLGVVKKGKLLRRVSWVDLYFLGMPVHACHSFGQVPSAAWAKIFVLIAPKNDSFVHHIFFFSGMVIIFLFFSRHTIFGLVFFQILDISFSWKYWKKYIRYTWKDTIKPFFSEGIMCPPLQMPFNILAMIKDEYQCVVQVKINKEWSHK